MDNERTGGLIYTVIGIRLTTNADPHSSADDELYAMDDAITLATKKAARSIAEVIEGISGVVIEWRTNEDDEWQFLQESE